MHTGMKEENPFLLPFRKLPRVDLGWMLGRNCYNKGSKIQEQIIQRSFRCPIAGNPESQVGWDFEQLI